MEFILNNDMLTEASLNINFINSIDYTPNGFLLLASANQFYLLGMGGMPPVFNSIDREIEAFAVTKDFNLWIISENKLCSIDTLGNLATLSHLPIYYSGIVSSNQANMAYIYDRIFQEDKGEYNIYQVTEKEVYAKILSIPTPILSVFEYETSLLISTENKIWCVENKTKSFFELFSLPEGNDIISITGDTDNHAIYFSTQDTIYRIMKGGLEYICIEFGGILKYDDEGLLIFNPEKQLIVRFRNNILYIEE
jgi:hypothetical protein